jgi:hypothetical protein
MSLPAQIAVSFDFSGGATFGSGFVIGSPDNGVIGVNSFGSSDVIIPTVDLTPDVYSISIRRGRNVMKDTYDAGTAIVRVLDPLGYFNPQNPSSPYYGYLVPLRKLRISATTATAEHFLFSGYVNDYRYTFPVGQETAYVDIMCTDGFRLLQMSNVSTIADTGAGQDTGTRINKILDNVSFPASMRSISTGVSTCVADPATNRSTLDAIKNAEFSEGLGAFYMSADGTAVYLNRTEVTSSLGEPSIAFNQTTGIPYRNVKYAFDDKLIINDVKFNRVGSATPQLVYSQSSIDKYFPHSLTQENLVAQTDDIVLGIAQNYVNTRKETTIRIDEMLVDLLDPAVPTDTLIGLDYFDNLEITNVTESGSTITKTLQAQGFAWDITANKMQVAITTLEPIVDGFIIGSSTYGIIGTSTLSY